MSPNERGDEPPAAGPKHSADLIDLPLTGTAPVGRKRRAEQRRPAAEARKPAGVSVALWRPWLVAALALSLGFLAGWLAKPDPAVAVPSPELLDFGEVRLATTSAGLRLEIANAGERSLPVAGVVLGGADGATSEDFAVAADDCTGSAVKAGKACAVEVTFSPSATGRRQAWLGLESEALGRPPRVPLLGFGVAPQLEAEPLEIDFGAHLTGSSSGRSSVRVANRGSAPVTISGVAVEGSGAGDFAVRDRCSGRTLAPGERCSLDVTFLPTAEGERSAEVRLKSDGGDALAAAPQLRGRGLPRRAALAVAPARLDFEPQATGTASAPGKVTLTNKGTAPLRLRHIEIRASGQEAPAAFELRSGACTKGTLAPGRSCAVEVVFRPAAEGDFAASLEIQDDAGGGTRRVPLAGAGTVPEIFLDPLVLDFGQVAVGTLSDSKFVRVVNSGSAPLVIEAIRLRGAGAQAFTARPVGCTTAPIKAKSSCGVEVRFKPHRGGAFEAEVVLTHNVPGGPDRIELRGLGKIR